MFRCIEGAVRTLASSSSARYDCDLFVQSMYKPYAARRRGSGVRRTHIQGRQEEHDREEKGENTCFCLQSSRSDELICGAVKTFSAAPDRSVTENVTLSALCRRRRYNMSPCWPSLVVHVLSHAISSHFYIVLYLYIYLYTSIALLFPSLYTLSFSLSPCTLLLPTGAPFKLSSSDW